MAQAGDKILCSSCGHESVAKPVRIMDGWELVEERLVCALCNAVLPVVEDAAPDSAGANAASAALASFLDEPAPVEPGMSLSEEVRFCRDCRRFLRHPFVSRCLLHERPTEPMDDCADFAPPCPPEDAPGDLDD